MKHQMERTKFFGCTASGESDKITATRATTSSINGGSVFPHWAPPVYFGLGWGLAFRYLPNLKSLVMDFDATDNIRADMETLVEWAVRTWRFPLGPNRPDGMHYLSTEGNPVQKTSWRGLPAHWPVSCPSDDGSFHDDGEYVHTRRGCGSCRRRSLLTEHGHGPRMYTWTITWTPRKDNVGPMHPEAFMEEGQVYNDFHEDQMAELQDLALH